MDIYLLDRNEEITKAWNKIFKNTPGVYVINDTLSNFLNSHPYVDGIVSPANSFGIMDGGYDKAIIDYFGKELQERVSDTLQWEYRGYQTPGTCIPIPIDRYNLLFHTPTMRYPEEIVDNRIIFDCMYNTLKKARETNRKAIVIPAFGGCTGNVDPEVLAKYMYIGYESNKYGLNSNWESVNLMRTVFYKADGNI